MKIFCIGRNYAQHAKELNNPIPQRPLVFTKLPSSLLRNAKPFYYPEFSQNIHYEGELVIRICKNGRHIDHKFAHTYYDAIAFGLDLTARDLQDQCKQKGHPWEIAKAFDGSAPLSEFIPLSSLNKPTSNIQFSLNKNGQTVQQGTTADLLFSFEDLLVYLSKYFILQQGDFIFTGTPAGVGPLQIGDYFEGYIEGQKLLNCRIK